MTQVGDTGSAVRTLWGWKRIDGGTGRWTDYFFLRRKAARSLIGLIDDSNFFEKVKLSGSVGGAG